MSNSKCIGVKAISSSGPFTPVVQLIILVQRVAVLRPVPGPYLDKYQVVAAEIIFDLEPFTEWIEACEIVWCPRRLPHNALVQRV